MYIGRVILIVIRGFIRRYIEGKEAQSLDNWLQLFEGWAFWIGAIGTGFVAQLRKMKHGTLRSITLLSSRLAIFSLFTGTIGLS